jgi:hypothetical protein
MLEGKVSEYGMSAEKSFVHLLDGAVIFGELDSGRVLCSDREFACLGGFVSFVAWSWPA